ncbi:TERF1-interacting nuclear factor 2-like, partial [Heptranchias perlo]|uniref:TERF1-interacting nuclear factor 2-like n=1 Tax=Heptranchias perlo TaxID=212740 RepID=UPI00355A7516
SLCSTLSSVPLPLSPDARPGLQTLELLVPPVRLAALAVWSAVARRDFRCYGRAVEFLETVNGSVPGLVGYRHFAKLLLGLKAKIILEMVLQDPPASELRSTLDRYFPEKLPAHPMATPRDAQKVTQVQHQFRELVLYLMNDPPLRTPSSLQVEVQEQYGEEFLKVLQKLLWEYLQRLAASLPRVCIEQLRDAVQGAGPSDPHREQFLTRCLNELDPPSLQLLLRDPGAYAPQDPVSLDVESDVEPGGTTLCDDGGLTFPIARKRPVPRRLAPSAHPLGEEGREEGSGRGPTPGDTALLPSEEKRAESGRGVSARDTDGRWRSQVRGSPGSGGRARPRKRSPPGQRARTPPGDGEAPARLRHQDDCGPALPRWDLRTRGRRGGGEAASGPGRERSPQERRSPVASLTRRWRLRPRPREKENTAEWRLSRPALRRPCVAGPSDRLPAEREAIPLLRSGPRQRSAEPIDIISDSEDESRDPLTSSLGEKGPLQLYHRTKHDTYIPTLVQHLQPLAMYPCYVALERMAKLPVSRQGD